MITWSEFDPQHARQKHVISSNIKIPLNAMQCNRAAPGRHAQTVSENNVLGFKLEKLGQNCSHLLPGLSV